ncbi:MAG: hypothetical protein AB7L09_02005 [Nitrospira sp.]
MDPASVWPKAQQELYARCRRLAKNRGREPIDVFRFGGFTVAWNDLTFRVSLNDGHDVYVASLDDGDALAWDHGLALQALQALRSAMVLDDLAIQQ